MNYIDPIYDWANEGSPTETDPTVKDVSKAYPKPETEEEKKERLWKLVVETSRG